MSHTFTLETEDLEFDFEETAFISFHTPMPHYAFALDLNSLYGLSLARVSDISVDGCEWPLFVYHNEESHLDYFLVEKPAAAAAVAPAWKVGDKLFILRGRDALDVANRIENDFNATVYRNGEGPNEIIAYYQESLAAVSLVSFSDAEIDTANQSRRRKRDIRANLADLFARILDEIEKVCPY